MKRFSPSGAERVPNRRPTSLCASKRRRDQCPGSAEAFIAAPPARVWEVLADFDDYAAWNPLNIRASGRAAAGARIPMTFRNPAREGSTIDQVVRITACEPGRLLEWTGHVPLLFRGRHFFVLEPRDGGTHLLHGEDQSGLIPLTFSARTVAEKFVPAYEAVNAALAERAGAPANAPPPAQPSR